MPNMTTNLCLCLLGGESPKAALTTCESAALIPGSACTWFLLMVTPMEQPRAPLSLTEVNLLRKRSDSAVNDEFEIHLMPDSREMCGKWAKQER